MSGEDVARAIAQARFTPVRLPAGYDMGEVDPFLEALAREARRGGDLAAFVRTASFDRVKWREGYDIAEVDEFLQRIGGVTVAPVAPTQPTVPDGSSAWAIRSLVERARFTPVRLREGYDMADVDRLLDDVVGAAERGEPVGPVIDGARFTAVRLREGYDMAEVDRLLAQLKGASPETVDPGVIEEQRSLLDRLRGRR
jgi:DivIVA domain-containing protein